MSSGGGRVYVVARVFPKGIEVNLEELKKKIGEVLPKEFQLVKIEEEPIAFGLKALKVHVVIPEETTGGTEPLERAISSIDDVSQVEVIYITRMFV
ncbi:MAG: elongation factor 1-beta [Thermoprotei archaeon]|nr:MAG: elongation factor 1-beta [Thermoprotei archaeon]